MSTKMGEVELLTFTHRLGIPKRHGVYRKSNCKKLISGDPATLCKKLVNFGSVTTEFKKGKDAHH